jgi:energy-converting hydrogenase A subunit P
MSLSIIWYLREFFRFKWLHAFLFAKTAPLVTPAHFRDYPVHTDRECTHCLACVMICPSPGAIEVIQTEGRWAPTIYPGHCIRCGLCVEVCPEDVLSSGRILETQALDRTMYTARFHIHVDSDRCMRCGNCVVSCPVNKELDPELGFGGHATCDTVIMKIEGREHRILHGEKTKGCKTCENTCPTGAIRVERMVEGVHGEKKRCDV